MWKQYSRNNSILICGTPNEIAEAEAIFKILDGLDIEKNGRASMKIGEIRLIIQEAIEVCNFTAIIMVSGKTVHPFAKKINYNGCLA